MALIRIDTGGLEKNISDMKRYITELDSLTIRLDTLLARISSSWDGAASEAYIAAMKGRLRKAQQMRKVLETFLSYMETAKRKVESLDSDSAARIRDC